MNFETTNWFFLRHMNWADVLYVISALILARLLILAAQTILRGAAERVRPRMRLGILRIVPITRLVIGISAFAVIIPHVVEPTFQNIATLIASLGLALAFALKDYGSSLVAGLVTVLENTYQPGDWIEVAGTYGEVKSISLRAVHLVTADDSEVIVPHARIWSESVHNATSGSRSLLCVTDFYLHPDHDAAAARSMFEKIADASSFRKLETPVTVIVLEKPWGTHYRVKCYARESREQFLLISDISVRGKTALRDGQMRFAPAAYVASQK